MRNLIGERRLRRAWLLSAAALALTPGAVLAQAAPTATTSDAVPPSDEEIVVTGTSRARAALDTPLAVTALDEGKLSKLMVSSQADVLNSIPTIKADAGGGEVASNVFIRGLPSGGQYQFTPLMYDGMPVFSTFGLNSSAFDVYARNDLGISRLEFVRGGVSNLFGPGSVAGLINYISKTGGPNLEGTAQAEIAEEGRYRGDVAISGPMGENTYFALSGYYRTDKGPIDTDLDTKGFQLRGNIKHEFSDNSGSVTVYGQYIDDQVQFYLPIPLNGTTRARAPGNDGKKVYSVQNNAVRNLGFATPDGPFSTDIEDGVLTRGGMAAIVFDKKFGEGWGLNSRIRYADYKHKFGLWSDGDGVVNVPETPAAFVTNTARRAQIPELAGITAAQATFTYADGSGAVPAGALLFANRFTDRNRPATDFSAEANLTKQLTTGGVEHSFTLGGFYADAKARDVNVTTAYLAEFANTPRLVNLTVATAAGPRIISNGGLLNAGGGYVNNRHTAERYAIYGADQMESERWNFDVGFRWEHINGGISRERTATFVTDTTTPNLSQALRDVIWGNDTFLTAKVKTSEWAAAFGALYKVTDDLNLYVNGSRGYFFPEIRAVTFNALNQAASYKAEIIKQGEAGIKYGHGGITATVAGLYTKLDNRRQVLFVNGPGGTLVENVNIVATESYGLEGTLSARIMDNLRFDGNVTLQHHEYKEFDTTPANIGNELERQPNVLYNAGLYYDDSTIDVSLFTNYTGNNYTAANNAIKLGGFNVATFDAGYKIKLGNGSARIGVNVFNIFDTDATTEGSPRQDANQTTGGAYFVGRPVLPRRITGRFTFSF